MAKFDTMLIVNTKEYKMRVMESCAPYYTLCDMKREMRRVRNEPAVRSLFSVLHREDAATAILTYFISTSLKRSRLEDYFNPTA